MFNKAGCQRSLFSNKSVSGGPGASHKDSLFKATQWEFPNKFFCFKKSPTVAQLKGSLLAALRAILHADLSGNVDEGLRDALRARRPKACKCSSPTPQYKPGELSAHSVVIETKGWGTKGL